MIGYLKGNIILQKGSSVIIETHGVGYQVWVPSTAVVETEAILFVHTHVREDDISLYGFVSLRQKELFEMFLHVPGVGPKSALSIISHGSVEELEQAVTENNDSYFASISGIGKKTAQKIVIECASKMRQEVSLKAMGNVEPLVVTLQHLGFSTEEIKNAITQAKPHGSLEEQLTQCLKFMNSNA